MQRHDFPETLETARLLLRPFCMEDVAELLQVAQQDGPKLLREFAEVAAISSTEQAAAFISGKDEQWKLGAAFCYGLWGGDQKKLVGRIQVKNITWNVPAAELGYFIVSSCQRQGFAGEAIRAVLACAFEQNQFERIFVRILPDNVESLGLAIKLGFQREGILRNAFRCGHGKIHDVICWSLTSQDYRGAAAPRP